MSGIGTPRLDFAGAIRLNSRVMEDSLPTPVKLEVQPPKRFGFGALVIMSCYGFVLALPLVLAIVLISSVKTGLVLSILIPVLTLASMVFCLPFGLGNLYATKVVRSLFPDVLSDENSYIVQLTFVPRLRTGVRALFDDADDIGCLNVTQGGFTFRGDSVELALPWHRLRRIQLENIGLRGLYLYGGKIVAPVSGFPKIEAIEFAERYSWFLPGSRKEAARLYRRLQRGFSDPGRPTF